MSVVLVLVLVVLVLVLLLAAGGACADAVAAAGWWWCLCWCPLWCSVNSGARRCGCQEDCPAAEKGQIQEARPPKTPSN